MKKIKILSLTLENFKGVANKTVNFGDKTTVKGQNAIGKTTLADSFMWLLFDKNYAGDSKFQVRPLDAFNKAVDNVDIKVTAELEVDGKSVVIEKKQVQNWVKKRGSQVSTLQGNINSYKVNSVPMKEKEYKEYIAGLVDEDLFKLLTNPMFFTSKKWKEQRDVLLSMVDEISDDDVFALDKEKKFDGLQLALSLHTAEENTAIAKDKLAELKKEQSELPARIDALSKARTDIDVAEQELAKADLDRQVKEVDKQLENMESTVSEYQKFSDGIMQKKFAMSDMERTATDELIQKKRAIQQKIDVEDNKFKDAFQKQCDTEKFISTSEAELPILNKKKLDLQEQWKVEKAKVFDDSKWVMPEDALICSMCGQPLPEDKRKDVVANFEDRKARALQQFEEQKKATLDDIVSNGNKVAEQIKHLEKSSKEAKTNIEKYKSAKICANEKKNVLQDEYDTIADRADLSGNADYQKLAAEIDEMQSKLASMNSGADFRSQLKVKRNGLMEQLDSVNKIIASADNTKIDEQIMQYEERQKEVGQLVADQEGLLYQLEEFGRAKMNMLSSKINRKFKIVSWKLFDMQLNGGVKECCECMVNGVPYSDVNTGHKIVAGFDIINTLIGLHEVSCPVFTDNAEALSDNNIPDVNAQMIFLKVSNDAELFVESEE